MTKLVILEYPDSRLRKTAERVPVVDDAVRQLADDMLETMYAANGVGLAATQVDVHKRLLVLDVSEERNQPLILINPELLSAEGRAPGEEGCLSLPGIYDKLQRADRDARRAAVEQLDRSGARSGLRVAPPRQGGPGGDRSRRLLDDGGRDARGAVGLHRQASGRSGL